MFGGVLGGILGVILGAPRHRLSTRMDQAGQDAPAAFRGAPCHKQDGEWT